MTRKRSTTNQVAAPDAALAVVASTAGHDPPCRVGEGDGQQAKYREGHLRSRERSMYLIAATIPKETNAIDDPRFGLRLFPRLFGSPGGYDGKAQNAIQPSQTAHEEQKLLYLLCSVPTRRERITGRIAGS